MITQLDNGVRVIVLGQGTTMISDVRMEDDDCNGAILFANTGKAGFSKVADLPPEAVIIQINNLAGAYAYMRGLMGLLKTWHFEEPIKTQLQEFEQELAVLTAAELRKVKEDKNP